MTSATIGSAIYPGLKGKTVLVTGGGSGIGAEIVRHFAAQGCRVGFIDRNWTVESIRPFLLEAIELFGTDRCLFASDSPTDKLFAPFDQHLEAYHAIVADFSEDERRDLFGRNANRVYRLELDL